MVQVVRLRMLLLACFILSIMFPALLYSTVNGGHTVRGKNSARDTNCILQSELKGACSVYSWRRGQNSSWSSYFIRSLFQTALTLFPSTHQLPFLKILWVYMSQKAVLEDVRFLLGFLYPWDDNTMNKVVTPFVIQAVNIGCSFGGAVAGWLYMTSFSIPVSFASLLIALAKCHNVPPLMF